VARELVAMLQKQALREPVLLNVNVPDVPYEELRGPLSPASANATRRSRWCARCRHGNETVYWVGAAGEAQDAGEGTDFHAVQNKQVSLTPLQVDLTHNAQLPLLRGWRRMNRVVSGFGMTSQRTRARMIERLREQGIDDEEVLAAIAAVPRHVFVEEALASRAYEDTALPLGFAQTISQPYVVARMIEALCGRSPELGKTLEIGAGCGYQAAVLAQLTDEVYAVERIAPLAGQGPAQPARDQAAQGSLEAR
jgi:hypothetical protein